MTAWPDSVVLANGANTTPVPGTTGDGDADTNRPFHAVWFAYTPATDQTISLDTLACVLADDVEPHDDRVDTTITVFSGADFDSRVLVAFGDDVGGGGSFPELTSMTLALTHAVEYHIVIGTYTPDASAFTSYVLTASFTGANGSTGLATQPPDSGYTHAPDARDPSSAFYETEIVGSLAALPAGRVIVSKVWTQTAGMPAVGMRPDGEILRFTNPALQADTVFTFRLTVTDNTGAAFHNDHNVSVSAHKLWQLRAGSIVGINEVHDLSGGQYTYVSRTRRTQDVIAPYTEVFVSDDQGWLATLTTGCRTVRFRRSTSPDIDLGGGASIKLDTGLRVLPAPFNGTVDEEILNDLITATTYDGVDIIQRMLAGTATTVNALQVYGPSTYDAAADFGDYIGITINARGPVGGRLGKISAAGFVRLVYGEAGLGLSSTAIPAAAFDQARSGPGVQVFDPEAYAPGSTELQYAAFGDIIGFTDPLTPKHQPPQYHVGIYLGVDSLNRYRFVSSRPDTNGVSASDQGLVFSSLGTIPSPLQYSGWARAIRRY